MAIKGLGYIKTTWAFQERPVPSAKLNAWDDRIEDALELIHFLLNQAFGGDDGIVAGATADDLRVVALAAPALAVEVRPGYAFISGSPYKLATATPTPEVAVPAAQPRIDLVQARLKTWDVSIKPGTEAASPKAPAPDADCIALAELHLRPGMTVIKDTDDGINGFIVDTRPLL
jgi:hypothetical protein